jgi:hypothetical protein
MAIGDPIEVAVPAGAWKKVATNVTAGQISILFPTNDDWYWTQRATGSAAPTTENPFVKLSFQNIVIDSSVAIDVYVYVKNTAGRVRVI